MRRTRNFLTVGLIGFLASGCLSATEIRKFEERKPLSPIGESRPIMFRKVISKLARGQEIGTVQLGLLCIGQGKLFWKRGGQVQVGDEELADTLREELTKAAYQVVGDPNSLFEDPQEWKAEFLIAGVIKHLAMNVCYPMAGFGNMSTSSGEASIEVEWQVFERRSRSVVFTAATGGTAKKDTGPEGGFQAYYDAFAASVRNLLSNDRFASLMSRPAATPMKEQNFIVVGILGLDEASDPRSSEMIQYVQGTVVTIPVGTGHGSGFIVSPSGLVLTNAHVVGEGSTMITVELPTGRRVTGEVVRVNRETDVALIQLEKGGYLAAPVGSSLSLKVGDPVFAIGTPLNERFSRTVTRGVVSAFRTEEKQRLIQSDVTIHPGSSGGPLLDHQGRVVGLAQSGVLLGGKVGVGLNNFVPIDEVWKALKVQPQLTRVSAVQLLGSAPGAPVIAPASGSTPLSAPTSKETEVIEKLRQIQELREKGLITPAEAETRRREVLDRAFR